jgi:hypothetical protein
MPSMMTVLVVGDSHGNVDWMLDIVIPYAVEVKASKIVQVGDFGFIWPDSDYSRTLTRLNYRLDNRAIDLHFLPGNHEDHDKLERLASRQPAVSPEGHVPLRPRIFYTGKVSSWVWAGRRLAAVGGATSPDRLQRVAGQSWWPQEALSPAEAQRAVTMRRTEVLFTHDAPTLNPFSLPPDADALAHRQLITDVARVLRPTAWFHGHYHQFVRYTFVHDIGVCEVMSLDRDGSLPDVGTAVLHLTPRVDPRTTM